jgi:hypothetical protein
MHGNRHSSSIAESVMNEKEWDKRLLDFLKRTGEDIKAETQRLVEEVRDPAKQRKVKETLREFGTWAKQTAEEAAEMVETAVKKAETAFTQRVQGSPAPTRTPSQQDDSPETRPTTSPRVRAAPRPQGHKTVGQGKRSGARKPRTRHTPKTIGKKK